MYRANIESYGPMAPSSKWALVIWLFLTLILIDSTFLQCVHNSHMCLFLSVIYGC